MIPARRPSFCAQFSGDARTERGLNPRVIRDPGSFHEDYVQKAIELDLDLCLHTPQGALPKGHVSGQPNLDYYSLCSFWGVPEFLRKYYYSKHWRNMVDLLNAARLRWGTHGGIIYPDNDDITEWRASEKGGEGRLIFADRKGVEFLKTCMGPWGELGATIQWGDASANGMAVHSARAVAAVLRSMGQEFVREAVAVEGAIRPIRLRTADLMEAVHVSSSQHIAGWVNDQEQLVVDPAKIDCQLWCYGSEPDAFFDRAINWGWVMGIHSSMPMARARKIMKKYRDVEAKRLGIPSERSAAPAGQSQ